MEKERAHQPIINEHKRKGYRVMELFAGIINLNIV